MLVELALALALLTSIGLVVFKGSLDIMAPPTMDHSTKYVGRLSYL